MKSGHPWDFGKSFDQSAPCSPITPIERTGVIDDAHIWLKVNGECKQDARTSELIWSVPEIISILSHGIALQPGDLIYTGTPAGVSAIVPGDKVTGGIDGLIDVREEFLKRLFETLPARANRVHHGKYAGPEPRMVHMNKFIELFVG
jgi:2-keto-4-pentenoate hydratase/2-oxohepta-3-ene-1,7-dioic acid hydratase in catechol pathway